MNAYLIADSPQPLIYVVVPVHNRRAVTLSCLRSVTSMRLDGLNVRIVVVDDGSSDGTTAAVKAEFPYIIVLSGNGNLWWPGAVNMGVQFALEKSAEYILILNDDTLHHRSVLLQLVESAQHYSRSIVGALLLRREAPDQVFQCGPKWSAVGWRFAPNQRISSMPSTPWRVQLLAGNCVLYPRRVFEEVGLFDNRRFPHYGADAEMSCRARKAGWQLLIDTRSYVWCDSNMVRSLKGLSIGEIIRRVVQDHRSQRNVVTQVRLLWRTAPNRLFGALAIVSFMSSFAMSAIIWSGRRVFGAGVKGRS